MPQGQPPKQPSPSAVPSEPAKTSPSPGSTGQPPPFRPDYDLISYIEKGQKPIRTPSRVTEKGL